MVDLRVKGPVTIPDHNEPADPFAMGQPLTELGPSMPGAARMTSTLIAIVLKRCRLSGALLVLPDSRRR